MSNLPKEPLRREETAAQNQDAHTPAGAPAARSAVAQLRRSHTRNIRLVILILCGVVVLGLAVLLALWLLLPEQKAPEQSEYYFYPVDWSVNIFETGEYSESDRVMLYCNDPLGYGLKEQITQDGSGMEHYDVNVRFLTAYLNSIISGDNETYRSLFTPQYLQTHTLPRFTQQMLYQICIYYCGAETDGDGSQRVTYRVDYMIRKNNGSFRRDVGSDAIRPQYVVLLVSPDGQSIAIDDVYTRS